MSVFGILEYFCVCVLIYVVYMCLFVLWCMFMFVCAILYILAGVANYTANDMKNSIV